MKVQTLPVRFSQPSRNKQDRHFREGMSEALGISTMRYCEQVGRAIQRRNKRNGQGRVRYTGRRLNRDSSILRMHAKTSAFLSTRRLRTWHVCDRS